MCGICGYIGPKKLEEDQLWKMNNTMYHRGPDDGGVWQYNNRGVEIGLAQRRLSILDLSALGHQPMLSEDGRYVVVYNGEIYNFKEIRRTLERQGYHFRSNCDTEVILYAYAEWGSDMFTRFNGMFAIALYDKEENRLILARDRIGKKPLYYYAEQGHFVFASELKPIMQYPFFSKRINKDVLNHFLCNKYLSAPLCIFEHTYKMLPGMVLEYCNGEIYKRKYWNIIKEYHRGVSERQRDLGSCKDSLKAVLKDAVTSRLVADVPVGTFLSGGIDSTLVTAIAREGKESPINSYSIGFYDKKRDEAPFSAAIAKYLGTNHHEHYVEEKDIFAMIQDLPYYYDEPFSDASQLPTMLVSQYASQDITVSLSGDGGDELFCGYKMYDLTWIAQHVDFMGEIAVHIPGMQKLGKMLPSELRAFLNNREQAAKTQLYIDVVSEVVDTILGRTADNVKYAQERYLTMGDWQERRMLLDMQTYLPDEILAKTDRASMKYSLEVRCPLLDHKVVEESFRIPHQYKYRRFDKKYILKELTYDYVPRELLDRPKKGFGVPLQKWLRTVLKDEVARYADPKILQRQDIFVPSAVQELIAKQQKADKVIYSSVLWSFYVFQKWYQMYIEDLWQG